MPREEFYFLICPDRRDRMGHAMDGMWLSPSNSYVGNPKRPKDEMIALGLEYEGGVLMNGMRALIKSASGVTPWSLPPCKDAASRRCREPGRESAAEHNHADAFDLGLSPEP